MRQLIYEMLREAQNNLDNMKKEKMTLKDRISYEKAKLNMEHIRRLLEKCSINYQS